MIDLYVKMIERVLKLGKLNYAIFNEKFSKRTFLGITVD